MKSAESIVKKFVSDALKGDVDAVYCEQLVASLRLEKDEDLNNTITRELENRTCYCHDEALCERFGFSSVAGEGWRTDIAEAANEIGVSYSDFEDEIFGQAFNAGEFIFFSMQAVHDAVLLEKHFSGPGRVALAEHYKNQGETEPDATSLCENWMEYTEQEVLYVFGEPDSFGDPQRDLEEIIGGLKSNSRVVLPVAYPKFLKAKSAELLREKEYTYLIDAENQIGL